MHALVVLVDLNICEATLIWVITSTRAVPSWIRYFLQVQHSPDELLKCLYTPSAQRAWANRAKSVSGGESWQERETLFSATSRIAPLFGNASNFTWKPEEILRSKPALCEQTGESCSICAPFVATRGEEPSRGTSERLGERQTVLFNYSTQIVAALAIPDYWLLPVRTDIWDQL